MNVEETAIPEVKIITPSVYKDDRGFFLESFNQQNFLNTTFVQDNHSCSSLNTLRGLHYQINKPQGKLIRVVKGSILDVAIDIRRSSPTFKQWVAVKLSAQNFKQLWVPEGFAHAFLALEDGVEVLYKTTEYWMKEYDRSIRWNDPSIGIEWGESNVLLSDKDKTAPFLEEAEIFE
jgi:dTDP-4-dehydrorhamnose 3,5-epimerase